MYLPVNAWLYFIDGILLISNAYYPFILWNPIRVLLQPAIWMQYDNMHLTRESSTFGITFSKFCVGYKLLKKWQLLRRKPLYSKILEFTFTDIQWSGYMLFLKIVWARLVNSTNLNALSCCPTIAPIPKINAANLKANYVRMLTGWTTGTTSMGNGQDEHHFLIKHNRISSSYQTWHTSYKHQQ